MAATAALCGAAALVLTIAAPAAADREEHAAAVARSGIVLVTVKWHGWVRDKVTGEVFGGVDGYTVEASCGGAVVDPNGYVATASHCVHTGPEGGAGLLFDAALTDLARVGRVGDPAKAKRAMVEHALAEGAVRDRPVDRVVEVDRPEVDADGNPTWDVAPATVVDLVAPADGDVAVLKVPRDHLPALEVRSDEPPVGASVLAVGYPDPDDRTREPSARAGRLAAHRVLRDRPFHEVTAKTTPQMDGSPVVDEQGRVVGVVSRDSLAATSATLVDLLRGKGIGAAQGVADRNYRTGLDRYFDDDFDGAVEYLDAVLTVDPAHRQASEYRRLAAEKGGTAGRGPALPLVLSVLGWSVAAAVAAALVLVWRQGRPVSVVDTPPLGLPVALGVEPQPDGEGDADQAQRRERALGDDEADDQAEDRDADVEPGSPAPGGPGAAEGDQGDDAGERREDHRA